MAQIFGDTGNIAGGTYGRAADRLPDLGDQRLHDPPKAAMVFEGDFVQGVITELDQGTARDGLQPVRLPVHQRLAGRRVVGGGDTVDRRSRTTPATQAFVKYLATPEAATIWAKLGGFASPNKNVDPSVYPDCDLQATATALATAEIFRFDMSDLAPAAFGGTVGQGEWKILQDFLKNPSDVKGTQQALRAGCGQGLREVTSWPAVHPSRRGPRA